jgi:hypothetical protein
MSAPIPVFSDRPKAAPTPKLRALVKYPGNIVGGTGIDVTKSHGTVTVDMDWSEFASTSTIPTSPTSFVLSFDTVTQAYVLVPSSGIGSSSGNFIQAGTGAVTRTMQDKVRETVSITDFGAVGDDSNPNTGKIQAALNSGAPDIYIPAGTFRSSALTIPTTVRRIYGSGTLKANGTITDYTAFILATSNTNLAIEGITISVSKVTYPTVICIGGVTCTKLHIRNVNIPNAGCFGIYLNACVGSLVSGCYVAAFVQTGIYAASGNANSFVNNSIIGATDLTHHTVLLDQEVDVLFSNNYIYSGPVGGFGLCLDLVTRAIASYNRIRNTNNESISARGADICIKGNHLTWDGPASQDYGMSFNNADSGNPTTRLVIDGNYIAGSGKTGIAVGLYVEDCTIINNEIVNVIGNLDSHTYGIEIGDPVGGDTLRTVVRNNTIRLTSGNMTYGVKELGNCDYSVIENNTMYDMITGNVLLAGAHSTTDAWVAYTPSLVGAGSGTLGSTTVVAKTASYGKTRIVSISITVTSAGSSPGSSLRVSLPTTAKSPGGMAGANVSIGQPVIGVVVAGDPILTIVRSDGTGYPFSGFPQTITISGSYESV